MGAWTDVYAKLRKWAADTNGTEGSAATPKLTNAQCASILRYTISRAAAAHLNPDLASGWYTAARTLAGWRADGDKFVVTADHKAAMAPLATATLVWEVALRVSVALDGAKAPMVPPLVNPEDDYRVMLQRAWVRMQKEAAAAGKSPPEPLPPAVALPPPRRPSKPPSSAGGVSPLAIALLVFLIAENS